MKRAFIFLGIIIFFGLACTNETYEPGKVPTASDQQDINNMFPKTIEGLPRETFIRNFDIDQCEYVELKATYGDSSQIAMTITQTSDSKCSYLLLLKTMEDKKQQGYKVLANRKDMFIARKDNTKELYWAKEEYFFSLKANKENFSKVAHYFKYVIVKD